MKTLFGFGKYCESTVNLFPMHIEQQMALQGPVKLAFLGDSGADENAYSVLNMIKTWQPDAIIHVGDFDYNDAPAEFEKMITSTVNDIPYLAAIGNHDLPNWPEYQERLTNNMNKHGSHCNGEYGVKMTCNIKGVSIVVSGVGTFGSGHESYINQALAQTDGWKICGWHKNQHFFQTGHKDDEVGYAVYDTCRQHGAIIITGHEHSYARTKVMRQFENQLIASHDKETMVISPGNTFAIVSGLGGRSIRPWENKSEEWPWWASLLSSNNSAQYGAVLCDFYALQANCIFKDIDNQIRDTFYIKRTRKDFKRKMPTCKRMMDVVAHQVEVKNPLLNNNHPALTLEFELDGIEVAKIYSAHLQLFFFKQHKVEETDATVYLEANKNVSQI